MTPENYAKARVRVGDDAHLPAAERRDRPDQLPLGLSAGDDAVTAWGATVTVLGHARGRGYVEVGWDDPDTGLPAVSSCHATQLQRPAR